MSHKPYKPYKPYKLVIVESPSKCETIEHYLGPDYKCIASFGHLQELTSLNDIDISNNFQPRFHPIQTKCKQIETLRSKIMNADEVILATDDDREGESISWHICTLFNLSILTTKRIIFHEITKSALLHAINHPTTLNMNIVNSQFGRQILDMIVGYKITPVLWEKISRTKKLSAGRCQTSALRLVYDNQTEVQKCKGIKSYQTTGYFTDKMIPFTLSHTFETEDLVVKFLEDSNSSTHSHTLVVESPKDSIKKPPLPFNTSSLQQAASNDFHYSPNHTMLLCQKLYESGHITYMRTETKKYSNEFIHLAIAFITSSYGEPYCSPRINSLSMSSSSSSSVQAHEAIRPTNISLLPTNTNLNKQEKQLYTLIWKNTMESCMSNATYKTILVKIIAPQKYHYSYTCESMVFLGWKIIAYNNNKNSVIDATKTMAYEYLPKIKNKIVAYKKIVSKLTLSSLKSHYSESLLIHELEDRGIGRPSTFSSIIEKIKDRGYVRLETIKGQVLSCKDYSLENDNIVVVEEERQFGNETNKLVIQATGILVIELVLKLYPSLFEYDYTKKMESNLDSVADGKKPYWEVCQECLSEINALNALNLSKGREDIRIDANHLYTIGKHGPVIKCITSDPPTFLSVKSNIDLTKLKNQEYKLEDLIEKNVVLNKHLGMYNGFDVLLKKGKYGFYVCWDNNKKAITTTATDMDGSNIVLADVIKMIESDAATKETTTKETIVREVSKDISIRKGKYGEYIFYKTSKMSKPKFIALTTFKDDYLTCSSAQILQHIKKQ